MVPYRLIVKDAANPENSHKLGRLKPSIYLEGNSGYQEDYKTNYLVQGYKNEKKFSSRNEKEIKEHGYKDLPVEKYKDHEDLERRLEKETSPCVVVYNVNSREIKHLRFKNKGRMNGLYIWEELEDEAERWIEWDGHFPDVKHD